MPKATESKRHRVTLHAHNPVDDARGNAKALRRFKEPGLDLRAGATVCEQACRWFTPAFD